MGNCNLKTEVQEETAGNSAHEGADLPSIF